MEVAVFVSGVADPKWPLPKELTLPALQAHAAQRAALTPFDEAALELSLKLRDADPAVRITALVASDEAMTRRVAGFRPDAIHRIDLDQVPRWDSIATGQALSQALNQLAPDVSLVLVGREFGDLDDGSVPAALSHGAGLPHFALVLALERRPDGLWALRQARSGLERVLLPRRAVLSATNDPGNRLRHPLMKNVMAARKAVLGLYRPAAPAQATLRSEGVHPFVAPERRASCEWLDGSAQQKAEALARVLASACE